MSSNCENDSDTEEILVFAEFKDNVNIDKYNSIHVLGIDTKAPIFQLDDTFFVGKKKGWSNEYPKLASLYENSTDEAGKLFTNVDTALDIICPLCMELNVEI